MKTPFVTKEKIQEITKEIPTPFNIYDEKGIRENARKVNEAFSWNKGFKEYFAVNLSTLQRLAEEKNLTKIGLAELRAAGIVKGKNTLVKILAKGELKAALEVEANAFSKTAEEAIKAVGGNTTII